MTATASQSAPTASALLELRHAAGLTREELAALAGVSVRTIASVEREGVRPMRATAHVLAEALGCDPAEILPRNRKRPAATPGASESSAGQGRHAEA